MCTMHRNKNNVTLVSRNAKEVLGVCLLPTQPWYHIGDSGAAWFKKDEGSVIPFAME